MAYMNHCWNIVILTLVNKLHWNFYPNSNIFIQENAFENVVCEIASICLGLNMLKHITYSVWWNTPDNKAHGANMGPAWVLSAPDGPHVSPMNRAIGDVERHSWMRDTQHHVRPSRCYSSLCSCQFYTGAHCMLPSDFNRSYPSLALMFLIPRHGITLCLNS